MRFGSVLATLAAAAVVSAQNQSVTVNVGAEANTPNGGVYQFIPNQITATNGSTITFKFTGIPGNHSITQSTFASPCTGAPGGFDSGWVELLKNTTDGTGLPEWNLTITNDQTPIWFFCKQVLPQLHCASGMVGVINVKPGANSFAAFQAAAAKVASVDQSQGGLVGNGASASAQPLVPSEVATLFLGASASATAPGSSASGSAPGGSNTPAPGGAVALGFNFNLLVILGGAIIGATMVL
ncbi:hypothetical protein DFH08DRAFT_752786 [Mycena albidolilacea]|uniref:Extracellular serine-rich protein n=1 Tax=Mycena albidolilacea TaxID=1033008 RepID=A0AAD6ZIG8_9AGAR|nr:hypothetical protein DFH08DRAFT_752786 [Mycena albidolilacea]